MHPGNLNNIWRLLTLALVSLGLGAALHAAELLRFSFANNGADINENLPWTSTSTLSNQLRSFASGSIGLQNGAGLSGLANIDIWGGYALMKPSLTESIAMGHYVGFTVQAQATQALFLNGGNITLVTRSGNVAAYYPEFIALLSSVNGFASAQVISTAPWDQGNAVTLPVTGSQFDNLKGPVEFRLYIYRDDSNAGSSAGFRLAAASSDFISLSGTIDNEINLVAPPSLTATTISISQIDLAWDDLASNEDNYVLERSPNGTAGWAVLATLPVNTTTYSDTDLLESTVYFYRVKATCGIAQSAYSPVATTTTLGNPPNGASGLSVTALNGTKARLDWLDQAGNETGFRIERATAGGSFTLLTSVPANTTSYTDRTLMPNISYSYRIISINTVGEVSPSYPATVTTPLNSTLNFLIFGNSYSHFYEYLPLIAANRGDTVNFVAMRNASEVGAQLTAELAIEAGDNSAATLALTKSPLETDYNGSYRMKDILDQRDWDIISYQSHSSWANKFSPNNSTSLDIISAYFSHHEDSASVVYYHTTQYQNDEHLFRNLVNTAAHVGTLHGNYPYTEDQHVLDAHNVARRIATTYGIPVIGGGIVMENLRYDPRWRWDFPDLFFDYFNASSPAAPAEPANRRLHYGFRWESNGTSNNPKFGWAIDSHPHTRLIFLTACLWYETLFRKDVRSSTYRPNGVDEATAVIIRDVAHRTVKGELPPLRLADPSSRTLYADILWAQGTTLRASSDPDELMAGNMNLVHLVAYFPEHTRVEEAKNILIATGLSTHAQELAAIESRERPTREHIYQQIWDSCAPNAPVVINLSGDGDIDGDGQSNLLECAMNLNPLDYDPTLLPQVSVRTVNGVNWMTLRHRRNRTRTDFLIRTEVAQTLAPESWATLPTNSPDSEETILDSDLDGDGYTEWVEQRVRIPPGIESYFLRLRISSR